MNELIKSNQIRQFVGEVLVNHKLKYLVNWRECQNQHDIEFHSLIASAVLCLFVRDRSRSKRTSSFYSLHKNVLYLARKHPRLLSVLSTITTYTHYYSIVLRHISCTTFYEFPGLDQRAFPNYFLFAFSQISILYTYTSKLTIHHLFFSEVKHEGIDLKHFCSKTSIFLWWNTKRSDTNDLIVIKCSFVIEEECSKAFVCSKLSFFQVLVKLGSLLVGFITQGW